MNCWDKQKKIIKKRVIYYMGLIISMNMVVHGREI